MIKTFVTSLLVGAALVASPAYACNLAKGSEPLTLASLKLSEPTSLADFISKLYRDDDYASVVTAGCTLSAVRDKAFKYNRDRIKDNVVTSSDTVYIPLLVASNAAQAPEPAPNNRSSNTAPAQPASAPMSGGGAGLDSDIAKINARLDAGVITSAEATALIAELKAIKAQTQTTRVVEQPIYKTVQAGLSKADLQRFANLDAAIAEDKELDASQLAEYNRLKSRIDASETNYRSLRKTSVDLVEVANAHEKRLGDVEKANSGWRWDPRGWNLRDWLTALGVLLGTLALIGVIWLFFRKAGKPAMAREVRTVHEHLGLQGQRVFQVELPDDLEDQLNDLGKGNPHRFTVNGVNGPGDLTFVKVGGGLVQSNNLPRDPKPMEVWRVRPLLVRRYHESDGIKLEAVEVKTVSEAADDNDNK